MFRRRSNSSANPPPLAPFHRSSFAHPTGIGAGGGDSGSSSDRLAAMTKELERMKAELRAEYGEDLPLPERKEAPPRPLIPTVRTSRE